MGVNWSARLMRWRPYTDRQGNVYPLSHLHPFRYQISVSLPAHEPPVTAQVAVGFGLHCFTRKTHPRDEEAALYCDDRETRTFCTDRYALSKRLPEVSRSLASRPCRFAKNENYVTVDVLTDSAITRRYGVFFKLRKWQDGGNRLGVLLIVQSAYELDPAKPLQANGSIRFTRLVELTLQGIRPRPPR